LVLPYVVTIGDRKPHHTKLAAQIRSIARREGVGSTPLRIETPSDRTTAANAESIGIGPSERVVIWDTLLSGRYSPGEIRVVAAHELGHVARRHIWTGLAWSVLITIPAFFLLELAAGRREDQRPSTLADERETALLLERAVPELETDLFELGRHRARVADEAQLREPELVDPLVRDDLDDVPGRIVEVKRPRVPEVE